MASQQEEDEYDIFLSHSGAQKGFVRDLFEALSDSASYSIFFDQDHHSLPQGQRFPPLIFSAAKSCRLGIFVLSEEFVTSPWPMMELCAFLYPDPLLLLQSPAVHVASKKILPLFFKLSTEELKNRGNVERWWRTWKQWEEKGKRIRARECEEAVTKLLPSFNGVVRRPESGQGEASYIKEVIGAILRICPPPHHSALASPFHDPNKPYFGIERMCQVLTNEFRELAVQGDVDKVGILGMYGVPGSGKSTLCRFLCNSMFDEFGGNALVLKLPTEIDPNYNPPIEVSTPFKDVSINHLRQLYDLLPGAKFSRKRMFVALDNICPSNHKSYENMVQAILGILGSGSRMLLVSPSRALLEELWKVKIRFLDASTYMHRITSVPQLTESEAIGIVMHAQQKHSTGDHNFRWSEDLMADLFRKSNFTSSSMYIPTALDMIGTLLGKAGDDQSEVEKLLEVVKEGKKKAVQHLVAKIYEKLREDLQVLFLDIALFIRPSRLLVDMDVSLILRHMHDGISETRLKMNMDELRKHGFLSDSHLNIHDVFLEYARSISGMSEKYRMVNLPISNSHMNCMSSRVTAAPLASLFSNQHSVLKCHGARTIIVESPRDPLLDRVPEKGVDMQIERETKALIVRNHSVRSDFSVCLSGDHSSLVCLELEDVKQLTRSSSPPSRNDGNTKGGQLVWLKWTNIGACVGQKRKYTSWFLGSISDAISSRLMTLFPCSTTNIFPFRGISMGMKVLHLGNVAIQKLDIGSGCWPVLEKLRVITKDKNRIMSLIIGNAPKLTRFYILRVGYCDSEPLKTSDSLLELRLDECPELEEFSVDGRHFSRVKALYSQPSPKLLAIEMSLSDESAVQKLIASTNNGSQPLLESLTLAACHNCKQLEFTSVQQQQSNLRCIDVNDCPDLKHVKFWRGCLPNLNDLVFEDCSNLEDISIEPDALPNLSDFELCRCQSLTLLSIGSGCMSPDGLLKLRSFHLESCQSLTLLPIGPGSFPNLYEFFLADCTSLIHISIGLGALSNLRFFQVDCCDSLTHLSIGPGCLRCLDQFILRWCKQLQVIEGFDNVRLEQLQEIDLESLPQLRCHLGYRGAGEDVEVQLKRIIIVKRCPYVKLDFTILESSQNLYDLKLKTMNICNTSRYYTGACTEDMLSTSLDDASTKVFMEREHEAAGPFLCSDRPLNGENRPITKLRDRPSILLTVVSRSRIHHPWGFGEGTFKSLTRLHMSDLPYWQEIQGIQHLVKLCDLYLSNLPNLTHVLGGWPRGIEKIEFADCPMLRQIPRFEGTSNLRTLAIMKCKKLKAVEGCFAEMEGLRDLLVCECEGMEVFPIEEMITTWGKKAWWTDQYRRFFVWGIEKVAGLEEMRRWLRQAECGSPLHTGAVYGLLWEHLHKGSSSAFDALLEYIRCGSPTSSPSYCVKYKNSMFLTKPSHPSHWRHDALRQVEIGSTRYFAWRRTAQIESFFAMTSRPQSLAIDGLPK